MISTGPKLRKVIPGTIVGYPGLVEPGEVSEVRESDLQLTLQFLQTLSEGAPKFLHSSYENVCGGNLGSLEVTSAKAVTLGSDCRSNALGALYKPT